MMSQDDYSLIRVGEDQIGLRGLRSAIEEIAQSHGDITDEEVCRALLEKLSEKNYIADSARDEYCQAFVREFRKFLGQPFEEVSRGNLMVEVIGPGCAQCNRLEQLVKQVLGELGLGVSVEHVTDVKEMAKYGFVSTPALVINGKIVAKGTVPPARKIKEWLGEANVGRS
jgi:small redox-active disulfide protein 2